MGIEGYDESRWIVLDYGSVVVHLFDDETREYYDLVPGRQQLFLEIDPGNSGRQPCLLLRTLPGYNSIGFICATRCGSLRQTSETST